MKVIPEIRYLPLNSKYEPLHKHLMCIVRFVDIGGIGTHHHLHLSVYNNIRESKCLFFIYNKELSPY